LDEILRLASPVQSTNRSVTEDFEFEGASLKKGEFVMLVWAAANRDPAQFTEPDRMDLARQYNPHLAFGSGVHACLGLHLARLEAAIALRTLLRRLPHLRLASRPVEWNQNLFVRGPVRLYVEFDRS
jgi:cytochrome P450